MKTQNITLSQKIRNNFPPIKKIPIVFYQCYGLSTFSIAKITTIFKNVNQITTTKDLITIFDNYNYLNFIKLNDVETFENKDISSIPIENITNQMNVFCNEVGNTVGYHKTCPFEFFTLDEIDYDNNILGNIPYNFFILNSSGKLDLFESSQRDIIEGELIKNKQFNKNVFYEKEYFETLEKFINFFVKNCRILFLSKREDYLTEIPKGKTDPYTIEVLYPNFKDLKSIDLLEDVQAIFQYSTRARETNLYFHHALWAEYFLQKEADGLSVIDDNFTILYANEKRRQRHKNNILGKKCYNVFYRKNDACDVCFFKDHGFDKEKCNKIDKDETQLNILNDSNEIKIKDKAGNEYYLTEYNRIVRVTTVRLLLKQNQLVRKFMSKLVQIGSVKQLI